MPLEVAPSFTLLQTSEASFFNELVWVQDSFLCAGVFFFLFGAALFFVYSGVQSKVGLSVEGAISQKWIDNEKSAT